MGLGIHYSGRFNPNASLPKLIAEVEELATAYGWEQLVYERVFPSSRFDDSYSDKIYGIVVIPPNCDPLFLSFLSNGRMSSPLHLESFGYSDEVIHREYLYLLSVSTLLAGVDVHVKLVTLLKALTNRYFLDFEVNDEGGYWDTENEEYLHSVFLHQRQQMELVTCSKNGSTYFWGESIRFYLNRVMKDLIYKQ